jgi:AraC family transcriptional regulator
VPDLPNLANPDYVSRINQAIDHVTRNLAEPLRLEEVAKAACFSPFHFHRIFRSLMGETLASFVKRVRLERSVYLLSHREGRSLTQIAHACGFASSSDFSRSFRSHYGVPPSAFNAAAFRRPRREAMLESVTPAERRHRLERLPAGENPDGFEVRFRDLPARRVAYIRVTKAYQGGVSQAAARLVAWAGVSGWDTSGTIPRSSPSTNAGTTWESRSPEGRRVMEKSG